MSDIATYIRIVDATPTDDAVTKCNLAVNDIAARYSKKIQIADILGIANDIAMSLEDYSSMPDDFLELIGTIINKHSPSFLSKGNELHILVVGLLAAKKKITERSAGGTFGRADVLAAGLWSALSFQEPHECTKLEELRAAVLERARVWTLKAAESSRHRASIPDVDIDLPEGAGVATVPEAVEAGITKTIDALQKNANFDREELDILWWALGDWSDAAKIYYSEEKPHVAAVVAGIDLGRKLLRLPSDGHGHLLKRVAPGDRRFTLTEVISGLEGKRDLLIQGISSNRSFQRNSRVFPLMNAIVSGSVDKNNVKLTAADWGARSLLESALLHIPQMLDGK